MRDTTTERGRRIPRTEYLVTAPTRRYARLTRVRRQGQTARGRWDRRRPPVATCGRLLVAGDDVRGQGPDVTITDSAPNGIAVDRTDAFTAMVVDDHPLLRESMVARLKAMG